MASLSSSFSLSSFPVLNRHLSSPPSLTLTKPNNTCRRRLLGIRAAGNGGDLLGDFGARDPFPAEIASNFGDKVVGIPDTEHRKLIPNIAAMSLSQRKIESIPSAPMSMEEASVLLRKLVGWRLVESSEGTKLQCLWKVRDPECAVELIDRIEKVVNDAGHRPDLHLEQPNQVRAELWTASIGGLSINDFIVAAKIDDIKTMDLLPRKRAWA